MQTIKTATIRLTPQEVDYVSMLQNRHKQEHGVNLSQSDLFRLLLKKETERLQLDKEEIKIRDISLMQRIRSLQKQKKST